MKHRVIPSLICAVLLLTACAFPVKSTGQETLLSWEVYFSPNGGCTDAIVRELDKAQSSVLVLAYSFTSYKIAKGLLDAHKRGVKVEIILDKSQKSDQYSSADFLANSGMSVKIDSEHAIAHSKVMVIDGETVITGSFNFTKAAEESNAGICL